MEEKSVSDPVVEGKRVEEKRVEEKEREGGRRSLQSWDFEDITLVKDSMGEEAIDRR